MAPLFASDFNRTIHPVARSLFINLPSLRLPLPSQLRPVQARAGSNERSESRGVSVRAAFGYAGQRRGRTPLAPLLVASSSPCWPLGSHTSSTGSNGNL